MSDDDVAQYQRDASYGHRPTWTMGVNRAAATDGETPADFDPKGMFGDRFRAQSAQTRAHAGEEPRRKRPGVAALKALGTLGLDETADANQIKTRYKDLVKRLHPDANGGDRSSEDKLREIIHAYNYLRSAKLA